MRIYAEGDFPVTEHLGHRQDFEDELGRRGFRHEEFTLHVQAAFRSGPKPTSIGAYAVRVTHVPTRRWTIYRCGPRDDWLAQFKEDLSMGVFGHRPHSMPRSQGSSARNGVRPQRRNIRSVRTHVRVS